MNQRTQKATWNHELSQKITQKLTDCYHANGGISYCDHTRIPERRIVIDILHNLMDILFPGYSGNHNITEQGEFFAIGNLLNSVHEALSAQIARALAYKNHSNTCLKNGIEQAEKITADLLAKLPELRTILLDDAQAALEGDPATRSLDEIILAYPGFNCICVNRIAHELYLANVPLIPRVMSEYAHTVTGIDIHPGASIGRHFFIDHGTGVVIGETAIIGNNVKLYQGVTLGALSFPKDAKGNLIKGNKRHPNIEDNVTIYAESTILGNVTIGHDSIIGGNVWLTKSIPPFSKVTIEPAKASIEQKRKKKQ